MVVRLDGASGLDDGAGGPATLVGQSAAKAWANYDGTGTAAINESLAVSSLTDNGTGAQTLNLTNAFTNDNFASLVTSSGSYNVAGGASAASAIYTLTATQAYALADVDNITGAAWGDLA
jgi:hypothetical protein